MPVTKSGSIYYEVVGKENSVPITLLMGLGMTSKCWSESLIDGLVNMGFKVILIDNRDTKRSFYEDRYTPAAFDTYKAIFKFLLGFGVTSVYTLADMASDVVLVLDELKVEKTHILGISLGGMIAQVFAARYPDRTLSLESLSSAVGNRKTGLGSISLIRKLASGNNSDIGANSGLTLYRALAGSKYPVTKEEEDLYSQLCDSEERNPEAVRRQIFALLASGNRAKEYAKINVPIFLFHGDEDPLLPISAARELEMLNKNAHLTVISGMGHQLPVVVIPRLLEELRAFFSKNGFI